MLTTTPLSQAPHFLSAHASPLPPALDTDPVTALRRATQRLHARLDQGLPLARSQADLADYAQHLVVLRDWQQALAPWLLRAGCDFSALELIAQDLADYRSSHGGAKVTLKPVDTAAVRRADDGSLAYCWGIAYVLEGSRLGGQVLYRRVQPRLAPHPLRYLGERAAQGATWGETLTALRRALDTDEACRSGCAGAVAAFQTLLQRFEEAGCLP